MMHLFIHSFIHSFILETYIATLQDIRGPPSPVKAKEEGLYLCIMLYTYWTTMIILSVSDLLQFYRFSDRLINFATFIVQFRCNILL